jgi:hypothetical protein
MRLIITDTNIFFDLISVGALPEFFGLEMDICTTEFVINEIKPSKQRDQIEVFIRAYELTVFSFTAEELELIVNHDYKRSIKGITDKSVFWKSIQLKCPLLPMFEIEKQVKRYKNKPESTG